MLEHIPVPPNHKLVGFEEIKPVDSKNPILYKPVYERVFALHGVFWDKSRSEHIYLLNDTQGYTCEGELTGVNVDNLELLNDIANIEMFWDLLSHNGYKIDNGILIPLRYWRPVYTVEEGFTPLPCCSTTEEFFNMFKSWGELFDTKEECAQWCNTINKFLQRNYPEVK